jgi:2'-5' RNA ligase
MRLFAALEVPASLKDQIEKLPRKKLDYLRLVRPDDLHITLCFLGDMREGKAGEILQSFAEIKPPPVFTLEASGLGIFEKKNHAVLYARIPSMRKISLLAEALSRKAHQAGIKMENKPYVLHVTVARLKDTHNVEDYIRRYGGSIQTSWQVREFCLMESANAAEGEKRYTVLERYALPAY